VLLPFSQALAQPCHSLRPLAPPPSPSEGRRSLTWYRSCAPISCLLAMSRLLLPRLAHFAHGLLCRRPHLPPLTAAGDNHPTDHCLTLYSSCRSSSASARASSSCRRPPSAAGRTRPPARASVRGLLWVLPALPHGEGRREYRGRTRGPVAATRLMCACPGAVAELGTRGVCEGCSLSQGPSQGG
jgi:hypothetical protein